MSTMYSYAGVWKSTRAAWKSSIVTLYLRLKYGKAEYPSLKLTETVSGTFVFIVSLHFDVQPPDVSEKS